MNGLGAICLFFATRFVTAMLYNLSAWDPVTLLSVAGTLTAVALLAAFVPALRAARLNPIDTLRSE